MQPLRLVLALLAGSRRAQMAHAVVHWLDEGSNQWLPLCDSAPNADGDIQADLQPSVVNHPCWSARARPAVRGCGGDLTRGRRL